MTGIVHSDDAQFEEVVLKSDRVTVVDFGAEWCGPCKKLNPILGQLAQEFQGRVKFVEIDVDRAPETALKYGITSVPQLLFFLEGQVLDTVVGLVPKSKLVERIELYLSKG